MSTLFLCFFPVVQSLFFVSVQSGFLNVADSESKLRVAEKYFSENIDFYYNLYGNNSASFLSM